jgi:uncharacterized protein YbjT (DUF2867 family)
MRVLVLGGYGLIGGAVVRRLLAENIAVTALGREVGAARRRMPDMLWYAADIARLRTPADWRPVLSGIDAVVNAAGALQDGARDDLAAVHHHAMVALYAACAEAGLRRFVQISAVGAAPDADTAFLRTKAAGDAALAASSLDWVILRPGLVIGAGAYGGTALLRALAAFPCVTPLVLADRPVQTVAVGDVAAAVARALAGDVPSQKVFDLVEDRPKALADVVAAFRAWLGLPPAPVVPVPALLGDAVAGIADGLGRLGWRSPLRSTAMRAVTAGVTGDPEPWREATGVGVGSLEQTLQNLHSTVQERWFARLFLLKPAMIGVLSLVWLASGLIGLAEFDAAAAVLTQRAVPDGLAAAAVLAGSAADLVLGGAVLVRRFAKPALLGMIAVTLAYLVGATIFAPDLWLDPLGALVKTVPAMLLALVGLAILEER